MSRIYEVQYWGLWCLRQHHAESFSRTFLPRPLDDDNPFNRDLHSALDVQSSQIQSLTVRYSDKQVMLVIYFLGFCETSYLMQSFADLPQSRGFVRLFHA
jgi:hypothetical protein